MQNFLAPGATSLEDASALLRADVPDAPAGGAAQGATPVGAFVEQYLPLAQKVSQSTGVAPEVLLGQWGMETGWGKSVIPGTNNLGNIKDPSRQGPVAVDNMTKKSDSYMKFDSPEQFGDHYTGLLGRRYRTAMNSGSEAQKFFTELQRGGYAEDRGYVDKGVKAVNMVTQALGGSPQQMRAVHGPAGGGAVPSGQDAYHQPSEVRHYLATPAAPGATTMDYAKEILSSAIDSVGSIGQAAGEVGAAVANEITGSEDFEGKNVLKPATDAIRGTMSEGGKAARSDAPKGDVFDFSSIELPKTGAGWAMTGANAFGSLAPMLVMTIIPGLGEAAWAKRAQDAGTALKAAQAAGDAAKAAEATTALQDAQAALKAAAFRTKAMGAFSESAMTGGAAAADVRDTAARTIAQLSHEDLMQVPAYRQSFEQTGDEQQARSAVVNSAAKWAGGLSALAGAGSGAFNAKVIEDIILHKGIVSSLGKLSDSRFVRAGIGALGGHFIEGTQEGLEKWGQNVGENIGLGRPALENSTRDTVGDVLGGALVGGPMGAVTGGVSIPEHKAVVPPGLEKVKEKADAGGVLSKAAMASAPAAIAQQAAQQNAQAQTDPAARLAELEKIAQSGTMLTEQEAAEHQKLASLRDATNQAAGREKSATEAAEAKVNAEEAARAADLTQRSAAIAAALRKPGALQSLRSENSPVTVASVLNDLATAQSPSTDPGRREQALARLEFALEWTGINTAEKPTTYDTATAAPAREQAAAQQDSSNAEAAAKLPPQVDVDLLLPALKVEPALRSAEQTAIVKMAESRYQPQDMELLRKAATYSAGLSATEKLRIQQLRGTANPALKVGRDDAAEIAKAKAPTIQEFAQRIARGERPSTPQDVQFYQNNAQAIEAELKRIAESSAPKVQAAAPLIPHTGGAQADASGNAEPAVRRKRRAQLRQIIDMGINRVERRDDGFYLTDGKREFKLDSPADAALARAEVTASVDAKAARTESNPSDAKVEAYNFAKGEPIKVAPGVHFLTETKKGDVRRSKPGAKKKWQTTMQHHYGDIQGTKGMDGDAVDAFWVGDGDRIFVIDQLTPDGKPDEHKVMLRARDEESARRAYLANYEKGWQGLGAITEMTHEQFKQWVHDREATQKPASGVLQRATSVAGENSNAGGQSGSVGAAAPARGETGGSDQQRGSVGTAGAGRAGGDVRLADGGNTGAPAQRSGADSPAPDAGRRSDVAEVGNGPDNPETGSSVVVPIGKGRKKKVQTVDVNLLGNDSPTRGARKQKITSGNGQIIQAIAKAFGKDVVFFRDPDGDLGDGFVMPGISTTIFINEESTVNHLSVFGHELLHLLQRDMPKVHAILRAMVSERVKDGGRGKFRDYYNSTKGASDDEFNSDEIGEFTSDLGGEFLSDPKFWRELMERVKELHPDEAKGMIAQLAARLFAMIDHLVSYIKKQKHAGFRTSQMVDDLESIRGAYKEALAQYLGDNGIRKSAMRAQQLKAETSVKRSKARDVTQTEAFKKWFGDSKAVEALNAETGRPIESSNEPKKIVPQVMYHTSRNDFKEFEVGRKTVNSGTFGDWETSRAAIFVTPELAASQAYGTSGGKYAAGANVMPLYVKAENPLDLTDGVSEEASRRLIDAGMSSRFVFNGLGNWAMFDDEEGASTVEMIKKAGYDSVIFNDENPDTGDRFEAWALFEPSQLKSAIGNDGNFDPKSADITRSKERDNALDETRPGTGEQPAASGGADGDTPRHGKPREGSVSAVGIHFSQQPRKHLDAAYYGTGLKGAERERLSGRENDDIRPRVYFYVDKGQGVRPESGVGGAAHRVQLDNLYDVQKDPLGIVKDHPGANNWERAVMRAGFDGYLNLDPILPQGYAVLVGKKNAAVPVKQTNAPGFTAPAAPASLTVEKKFESKPVDRNPELAAADVEKIPGAKLKYGYLTVPVESREQANAEMERIGSDVRFSRARDVVIQSPKFRAWFDGSKVVDNGKPLMVFHGTTNDFAAFDHGKANIESDLGGGFYFSNTPADVANNYANEEGPDLTARIERLAEHLSQNQGMDPDEAQKEARKRFSQGAANVIPVFLSIKNPVVIGGPNETRFTYEEPYNEETEEYGEPTGTLVDFVAALRDEVLDSRWAFADVETAIAGIWERMEGEGEIGARTLIHLIKSSESMQEAIDAESETADSAASEIVRRAFAAMGFDGFIDNTVNQKFGTEKLIGKPMQGMGKKTVHYIAFEPEQIKSAVGNNGDFSRAASDITRSKARVSDEEARALGDLRRQLSVLDSIEKCLG